MDTSKRKQQTVEFYDSSAKQYADRLKKKGAGFFLPEKAQMFMKLLPQGKLLEIGCGVGNEAKLLIELGYDYVGIDVSSGMLEEAKKNVPTAKLFNIPVEEVDTLDTVFDGFWANLSLVHVPKAVIPSVLEKIKAVVKKGGIGYITLKEGELEGTDPKGRFFAHYNLEEFSEKLEKQGIEIVDSEYIAFGKRHFLSFIVRLP